MKISLIKSKKDKNSFNLFKGLGFNVIEMDNPEETDNKIKSLVKQEYKTIIITNEIASFSEDIIKKYKYSNNVNIIITSSKNKSL